MQPCHINGFNLLPSTIYCPSSQILQQQSKIYSKHFKIYIIYTHHFLTSKFTFSILHSLKYYNNQNTVSYFLSTSAINYTIYLYYLLTQQTTTIQQTVHALQSSPSMGFRAFQYIHSSIHTMRRTKRSALHLTTYTIYLHCKQYSISLYALNNQGLGYCQAQTHVHLPSIYTLTTYTIYLQLLAVRQGKE